MVIVLHMAFTTPEYRRKGVGTIFMEWGTQKADSMGLECWLDATDNGRPLYEKHGFIHLMDHFLDADIDKEKLTEAEREELKKIREETLPIHITSMWRPVGGWYVEGMTVKPWEVESNAS